MSVEGASIQLNKGFRQYWWIQKLGGRGLLARFNFTSNSPKCMHITLQVSLQLKSQAVSVHRLLHLIRTNVREEKKNSAKCLRTPKNRVGKVDGGGRG